MSGVKGQRIRISAKSLPILDQINRHVEMCNIRGDLTRFRDVASDSCDGHFYRSDLNDLIKRRLLMVIPYDDDPIARYLNKTLCGSTWSIDPTERLINALWHGRLALSPNPTGGDDR